MLPCAKCGSMPNNAAIDLFECPECLMCSRTKNATLVSKLGLVNYKMSKDTRPKPRMRDVGKSGKKLAINLNEAHEQAWNRKQLYAQAVGSYVRTYPRTELNGADYKVIQTIYLGLCRAFYGKVYQEKEKVRIEKAEVDMKLAEQDFLFGG